MPFTKQKCEECLRSRLATDPVVQFLFRALKRSGCPIEPAAIRCVEGPSDSLGEFDNHGNISIYADNIGLNMDIHDTLRHELVHAFDRCRVQQSLKLEPGQVESTEFKACSEIRAAMLSGDCHWSREWLRGNVPLWRTVLLSPSHFIGAFKKCIERRSKLALSGQNEKDAVSTLLSRCVQDKEPFFEIPNDF